MKKPTYPTRNWSKYNASFKKTIFGDQLKSRQIDNQFKELILKRATLNRMTHLGMPDSVKGTG